MFSTTSSEPQTFGEMFWELLPLIGVVAVAGPPVVFFAGPLLFLVLMLIGPFALIVTLTVVAVAVTVVLVGLAAGIVELARLLAHRVSWPHIGRPQPVQIPSPRVAA